MRLSLRLWLHAAVMMTVILVQLVFTVAHLLGGGKAAHTAPVAAIFCAAVDLIKTRYTPYIYIFPRSYVQFFSSFFLLLRV